MPGRICKEQGCGRPVKGRGMCGMHYKRWNTENKDKLIMRTNEQAVLDCMPGTVVELIERSGICRQAINSILARLNVAGKDRQAYIDDYRPPQAKGHRWRPIWCQGSKPNKRLSKERKDAFFRAGKQKADQRRRPRKVPLPPPPHASWLAVLPGAA